MVIGDIAIRNARNYPSKIALVFGNDRYTFKEFNDRVNRLTRALLDSGVERGGRIAILAENCPQYAEAYFATAKGGLVILPLNARLAGPELVYIINDAQVSTLLVEKEFLGLIDSIWSQLETVANLITIGEAGENSYELLISRYPPEEPDIRVDEDDLACLMYTSGTTGRPKGAMLTHRNLIANALNPILAFQFRHDDITLHLAALYHVAAQWPLMSHFYLGATNVLLKKFEPLATLKVVETERITTLNAVPVMISGLLDQLDKEEHDLSSASWIGYGASPMPLPLIKRALHRFGQVMVQLYGLTESGGIVTWLPQEDHIIEGPEEKLRRLTSCGKEIINVEVRVVDEAGQDVAPGQVGEIIVRGDNVMKGYWAQPEATAETLKGGYLHTGDLATVDEEGYIYIVDRKKDMIISGGENIYSREVEEAIFAHPAVRDVAVIGVPDEKWGEAVKAVVVLKEGATATEEEIIEFCRQRIASYKKPKSVDFVPELPRNATGKVLKTLLREQYG
ncbi:MAG TPA: fatty acid--CoA ligase [Dehalococcoidia bacterium]|jgi:acyl-CoA synthetase (AMP-forming)/AMP-acid ligase II|nr:fatty acid--CoA ligase [Dehalococcoidia bacterium]